tara:strand:+ start:332 stop:1264 length:933 start_codon:yes stop_codon:yes gene_type:complete
MQYSEYLNYKFPKDEFFHFANLIELADFYICNGKEHDWWQYKSQLPKIDRRMPKTNSIIYAHRHEDLYSCFKKCKIRKNYKYIIIQSRTDHAITKRSKKYVPDNIIRIFAHNINTTIKGRIIALPYGVKFDIKDQKKKKKNLYIGNFKYPNDIKHHKKKLLYCNFSLHGHGYRKTRRQKLYDQLHHKKFKKWITFRHMGNFGKYPIKQSEYYNEISHHKFTLSPEGAGIDCYRTWEALYLKSIPIVQKSRHMQHFSDLPILFTKDYEEINESYLKEKYREILEKEYNFDKLKWSFWKNKVISEKRNLYDN